MKSLLKDRNVLYVVFFIAVANLFAYLMLRQLDAIVFFLVVGFLSSYFSKNMIVIMVIAILSTNFLVGTKILGKKVKEGLENAVAAKKPAMAEKPAMPTGMPAMAEKPVAEKPAMPATAMPKSSDGKKPEPECKGEDCKKTKAGFTTLSPASVHEGEQSLDHKVDYAATLESAYDNLDKLLGSDAIRSMTQDTQRLAEKQQVLMGNIKQLQPMMLNASKMLDGLNVGQMGDMLTSLETKFKKFTGSSATA